MDDQKCKCGQIMDVEFVDDSGSSGDYDYAYNVYHCSNCGMIMIEHVWEGKGKYWIDTKMNITKEVVEGE